MRYVAVDLNSSSFLEALIQNLMRPRAEHHHQCMVAAMRTARALRSWKGQRNESSAIWATAAGQIHTFETTLKTASFLEARGSARRGYVTVCVYHQVRTVVGMPPQKAMARGVLTTFDGSLVEKQWPVDQRSTARGPLGKYFRFKGAWEPRMRECVFLIDSLRPKKMASARGVQIGARRNSVIPAWSLHI